MRKEDIRVTHRMADGTICHTKEELAAYFSTCKIPPHIRTIIVHAMMKKAREIKRTELQ
ncbi:MAG: hypothetical protein J6R00_04785 [Lentisphaeria bacterium]|nr:hypothetical protein [Lentisphaeria bacterium]